MSAGIEERNWRIDNAADIRLCLIVINILRQTCCNNLIMTNETRDLLF